MKKYQVFITTNVAESLTHIYDYIANDLASPDNATRQRKRIEDAIRSLDLMPERYPLIDVEPERNAGLRKMPIDNYAVLYCIKGDTVFVSDVLYAPTNWRTRLQNYFPFA